MGINGKTVIVGVPGDDDMGSESGSAYMYERVSPVSDLSGDGLVNFIDFSIFAGEWLQSN